MSEVDNLLDDFYKLWESKTIIIVIMCGVYFNDKVLIIMMVDFPTLMITQYLDCVWEWLYEEYFCNITWEIPLDTGGGGDPVKFLVLGIEWNQCGFL